MATAFAFLGIWLISMVVALLAALQLGDFFGANDEFGLVILGVDGLYRFCPAGVCAGLCAGTARRRARLRGVGPCCRSACSGGVAGAGPDDRRSLDQSRTRWASRTPPSRWSWSFPALLAVLVQWGLVRRRWLRAAGEDDFTRWPWVTTAVAGLVILNPFGLAFLQATLQHSASDFMWQFTATVTGSRPCRAARDGLDRMLYQGPHFAPPFGRHRSVIARAGAN